MTEMTGFEKLLPGLIYAVITNQMGEFVAKNQGFIEDITSSAKFVSFKDQYLAGTRELMNAVGRDNVVPLKAHYDKIPDNLLRDFSRKVADFLLCRGKVCGHNPHPARPEPLFMCAWSEGVNCPLCGYMHDIGAGTEADYTCDGCGRVVTGAEDDMINSGMMNYGPISYHFGLCNACTPMEIVSPQ